MDREPKGPKKAEEMLKLFTIIPSNLRKGRPEEFCAGVADESCMVTPQRKRKYESSGKKE